MTKYLSLPNATFNGGGETWQSVLVIDLTPMWIQCGVCEREVPIRESVGWPWDNGEPIIDGEPTGGYRSVCMSCAEVLERKVAEVAK